MAGVLLPLDDVAADSSCSVSERGPVSSSDVPDEPKSKEIGDITP